MKHLLILILFFASALNSIVWADENAAATNLIARGDSAYHAFDHQAALRLYRQALQADAGSSEAAWKISRAYVDIGEGLKKKDDRKANYLLAKQAAETAIQIDSTRAKGYLFLSIALGRVALDAGAKERVRLSKDIKAAVEKSLALNPGDDIAWHVLGRWHRKIATLSWIERGFANVFLGGVPKEASVERAAECFERAIEIKPEAIAHHLELGITYEKLKQKANAIAEFQKVLALTVRDSDDPGYKETAGKRLKKLK